MRCRCLATPVQELKTVASEVDALDEQAKGGGDEVRSCWQAWARRLAAPHV